MIQLVVYQAFIVRNMAHQGIRTERDPHSIPGQIVGSDLLVQLQFYFGENSGHYGRCGLPGADTFPDFKSKNGHFENFPGEPAESGSLDAGFLLYRKL